MIARIGKILFALLAVLLLLAALFGGTAPGNRALLSLAASMSGGAFAYEDMHGALPKGLLVEGVRINTPGARVTLNRLALNVDLLALFARTARIRELGADNVHVVIREVSEDSPSSQGFSIPLEVDVKKFSVTRLALNDGNEEITTVRNIALAFGLKRSGQLQLRSASALVQEYELTASGELNIHPPFVHDMKLHVDSSGQAQSLPVRLILQAGGDAALTRVSVESERSISAQLKAELRDLLSNPGGEITAQFANQGDELLGPETNVEGQLKAQLQSQGLSTIYLDTLVSHDTHGQWPISMQASSQNLNSLKLDSLAISGPEQARATADGTILSAGQDLSDMKITMQWRDLASPGITGISSPGGSAQIRWRDGMLADLKTVLSSEALTDSIELTTSVLTNRREMRIQHLQANLAGAQIDLNGSIGLDVIDDIQLRGTWSGLSINADSGTAKEDTSGRFTLTGSPADYSVNASGRVGVMQSRVADLSLQARGDTSHLSRIAMRMQSRESLLSLDGTVAWAEGLGWELAVGARDFNPALLEPDWPGAVDAQIIVTGGLSNESLRWSAQIDSLGGVLRDRTLRGSGVLRGDDRSLEAENLLLSSGESRLSFNGKLAPDENLSFEFESPDLNDWAPQLTGQLSASGSLTGRTRSPLVKVAVNGEELGFQDFKLAAIDAQVDADTRTEGRIKTRIKGKSLQAEHLQFETLDVDFDGTSGNHDYEVKARGAKLSVSVIGTGQYSESKARWQSEISQLLIDFNEREWTLEAPARIELGQALSLSRSCMRSEDGDICLGGKREAEGDWQLAATVDSLNLAAFSSEVYTVSGSLDKFSLEAVGTKNSVNKLSSSLEARELLSTFYPDGGEAVELAIDSIRNELSASPEAVRSESRAEIAIEHASTIKANLYLPPLPWRLDEVRSLPLQGQASVELESLNVLQKWVADLEQLSGQASISTHISGTLSQPRWRGELSLERAQAFVPAAGIQVGASALSGSLSQDGNLNLAAKLSSGSGELNLKGKGRFDESGLRIGATIAGSDFQAANLPEAEVLVSPDLTLDYQPGELRISGDVVVPVANIAPKTFSSAGVRPSRDVVLVDVNRPEEKQGTAIYSDVNISLGDEVRFSAQGFNTRIVGGLNVLDEPGKATRASGELRLLDGAYTAYGQSLTLENGRITYAGGPVDDPGVDAVAVREVGNVRAGIKASGRLRKPTIGLFSSPSMDERDILSYILLGRPLGGASQSDASMLVSAASSLGLQKGEMISRGIASRFGIDDLSLSGSPADGQLAVTVGKYLSPKLYLGYGVGLLEPSNTVLMRYKVLDNWQLEAETGTTTGADILYTIER